MIRCGVDIVRISRLSEIKLEIRTRFIRRVYTNQEQEQTASDFESLAGLFAAKEAVSKALGTGIGRVSWQDIEILHSATGEPVLYLHGEAFKIAEEKNLHEWSVSISHDGEYAVALAVAQS